MATPANSCSPETDHSVHDGLISGHEQHIKHKKHKQGGAIGMIPGARHPFLLPPVRKTAVDVAAAHQMYHNGTLVHGTKD